MDSVLQLTPKQRGEYRIAALQSDYANMREIAGQWPLDHSPKRWNAACAETMMDKTYIEIVRLLLESAPAIFEVPHFAMKGGTAINLFIEDMPRLSVDIDEMSPPVAVASHKMETSKSSQAQEIQSGQACSTVRGASCQTCTVIITLGICLSGFGNRGRTRRLDRKSV